MNRANPATGSRHTSPAIDAPPVGLPHEAGLGRRGVQREQPVAGRGCARAPGCPPRRAARGSAAGRTGARRRPAGRQAPGLGAAAISASRASLPAGPVSMIPNGSRAHRAGRDRDRREVEEVAKLVYRPSRELTPTGSARTSSSVGCAVVVGVSSASKPAQRGRGRGRQPVEPLAVGEQLGGGELAPSRMILATTGSRSVADQPGVRGDVPADRRVALGDERPAVQQGRHVEQRRDVDLGRLDSGQPEPGHRGGERLRPAVGEPTELVRPRDGDPRGPALRHPRHQPAAATRRAGRHRAAPPAGRGRLVRPSSRRPSAPGRASGRKRSRSQATGRRAPRRWPG